MGMAQVEVRRRAFAETRVTTKAPPALAEGEVLARIERFGLTANNVSYALSGDMIGYWKFFAPADATGGEEWGVVPVWGFATVTASRAAALPVGTRFFGFLPMASDVVMTPVHVTDTGFFDGAAHRLALPMIYNQYQRVAATSDEAEAEAEADERCVLYPLFTTAFILADYLIDNDWFGAGQVVIGSASSKTGLGLCDLIHAAGPGRPRVIGLTSAGNRTFVEQLGVSDAVHSYDEIGALAAAVPTVFVDMAGNAAVIAAIHRHFGANLRLSSGVGATHWDGPRFRAEPGGVPHAFFFAPAQFLKREQEWGSGEVLRRATIEAARISASLRGRMRIERLAGGEAVASGFARLVANAVPPDIGIIASLTA